MSLVLGNEANPAQGFTQVADGAYLTLTTPTADNAGAVNSLVAATQNGSASISGVTRTAATDAFTQSFTNQMNTISAAGGLSGAATQTALNYNYGPFGNQAIAGTTVGAASLTNVSQSMQQSLNIAQGSGGSNLMLTQNAGTDEMPVTLAGYNVQVANSSTNASITGAVQLASSNVNVAQLGAASGTITQSSTNVSLGNSNVIGTGYSGASFNAAVSGNQISSASLNVIK